MAYQAGSVYISVGYWSTGLPRMVQAGGDARILALGDTLVYSVTKGSREWYATASLF